VRMSFRLLFTFVRDMSCVAASLKTSADGLGVVAFVRAEVLSTAARGPGATHSQVLKSLTHQRLIVGVRPGNGHRDRHAARIGQHRPLDPQLAAIGGVFACLFPPRAELSSSLRREPATPSRSPATRRTLRGRASRVLRTLPFAPTPENRRGSHSPNRTRAASPSTDNQSSAHTESPSRLAADQAADAPLYNSFCNSGGPARSAPTAHRESGETLTTRWLP